MNIETLAIYVLIGLLVAFVGSWIMPKSKFRLLGDIVAGVVGSLFGGWMFFQLGIYFNSYLWPFVAGFIGAMLLMLVLRLLSIF